MSGSNNQKLLAGLEEFAGFLMNLEIRNLTGAQIASVRKICEISTAKINGYQADINRKIEAETADLATKYGSSLTIQNIAEYFNICDKEARNWVAQHSSWMLYQGSRRGKAVIPTRTFCEIIFNKEIRDPNLDDIFAGVC